MTRLDKKHTYQEEEISTSSGLFGIMDSVMLKTYRVTNEELDKICEIATDDELELFTKEDRTFTESRKLLTFLRNKIYF
jgi:hypothetical protein